MSSHKNGHDYIGDVNWTLRSLIAAALLSTCAVATAMSATVNADFVKEEQDRQRIADQEAELVADLARYLADETQAHRNALVEPRVKPVRTTRSLIDFDVFAQKQSSFDFSSLSTAKIDGKERTCLAQAIYYEARSEARVGQLAVADVVLNRVANRLYPDTICEVVFEGSERRTGCQFSFTCDGSMDTRLNIRKWNASVDLAGAILAGMRVPVSRSATHYHADYVTPYWAKNLTPTATIGTHKFYKFPSRKNKTAAPASM